MSRKKTIESSIRYSLTLRNIHKQCALFTFYTHEKEII